MYTKNDECGGSGSGSGTVKTQPPMQRQHCPDLCPRRGPDFKGNIEDPYNPNHFVACWLGRTVGCLDCPANLQFNEEKQKCLYDGIYEIQPISTTESPDYV